MQFCFRAFSCATTQSRLAQALGIRRCYRLPLRICCFFSVVPSCYWAFKSIRNAYPLTHTQRIYDAYTTHTQYIYDAFEIYRRRIHLWETCMTGIWLFICAILSYRLTDGLLLRWIVKYSPKAILIRMMSLNMINVYFTTWLMSSSNAFQRLVFSIFMACIFACAYIIQNYITSDILLFGITKMQPTRQLNLAEIGVFTVVPIGLASFITMIFSLWVVWMPDHA
ncbi:hypothetical protein PCANB_001742 [Pneumocystis canis]|nr:hypothetical protein PCK1_002048 [Pneumocystis canis]KAG5440173.1 hypothetical protein PCANB_001742 [Pneumocystis canis]